AVPEEVAHRDLVLAMDAEVRDDPHDLVVEADATIPHEAEQRGRRRQRLGERGQVEEGLGDERGALRVEAARSARRVEEHLAAPSDERHRPREGPGGDRLLEHGRRACKAHPTTPPNLGSNTRPTPHLQSHDSGPNPLGMRASAAQIEHVAAALVTRLAKAKAIEWT